MTSLIWVSFSLMIVCGALGLEWADASNVCFALAALAAVVFVSALNVWEAEDRRARDLQEVPEVDS
jgi:hypothetical protein